TVLLCSCVSIQPAAPGGRDDGGSGSGAPTSDGARAPSNNGSASNDGKDSNDGKVSNDAPASNDRASEVAGLTVHFCIAAGGSSPQAIAANRNRVNDMLVVAQRLVPNSFPCTQLNADNGRQQLEEWLPDAQARAKYARSHDNRVEAYWEPGSDIAIYDLEMPSDGDWPTGGGGWMYGSGWTEAADLFYDEQMPLVRAALKRAHPGARLGMYCVPPKARVEGFDAGHRKVSNQIARNIAVHVDAIMPVLYGRTLDSKKQEENELKRIRHTLDEAEHIRREVARLDPGHDLQIIPMLRLAAPGTNELWDRRDLEVRLDEIRARGYDEIVIWESPKWTPRFATEWLENLEDLAPLLGAP
ncbi:MAG: hypothetical protein KDA28_08640, partial [Phycisphaerales bacterium]|nr:hypothetical protein [Phycisphaerales bacterium]